MENEELIKKWLKGSLSEAESEMLKRTKDQQSLNRLSKALLLFKSQKYPVKEQLQRLTHSVEQDKGKMVALRWLNPLLRVAAVFLLVFSIGYLVYYKYFSNEIVETIAKVTTELYLLDSYFVVLNVYSSLKYSTRKWSKKREVILQGEAFFKVTKGSKFDIKTTFGIISVLGTELNVKNWHGYFEVICYGGLVQVVTQERTVQLSANQLLRFIAGEMYEGVVLNESYPSWLNGESSFNSVPLYLVLKELERQYDVTIVADDIELHQSFTGGFDYKDIEIALESITSPVNLNYQIKADTIILFSDSQ